MLKRVNLYGGPGLGKSVIAAQLFAELKKLDVNIELVTEVIKPQAIEGRLPKSFDQFLILAKQIKREDRILPHLDYIITDSPILLNAAYTKKYQLPYYQQCIDVSLEFEKKYPGLHILLDREGLNYQEKGRFENYEQACEMDRYIEDILHKYVEQFYSFRTKDFDTILGFVKEKMGI